MSSIASALILQGKSKPNCIRGQITKQASTESTQKGGKKPTVPILIDHIRYDEVGHWPKPETVKKHCQLCQNNYRMYVESAIFTSLWLWIVTAMWISTTNKIGRLVFQYFPFFIHYYPYWPMMPYDIKVQIYSVSINWPFFKNLIFLHQIVLIQTVKG